MKIYLQHSENSAVGYYRIWQACKWLERFGLAEIKRPTDDAPPMDKIADIIDWADLLVFQRRATYTQFAMSEAIQEIKPCVYELDDNLLEIDRFHPQYNVHREKTLKEAFDIIDIPEHRLNDYLKTKRVVKVGRHDPADGWVTLMMGKEWDCGWLHKEYLQKATAITTTTDYLKEVYNRLNPNVYVLQNCIDFEIWDSLPLHKDNEKVVIGWAGGYQHLKDLTVVTPALDTILSRNSNVQFHFVRCHTRETDRLLRKYPNQVKYLGSKGCSIQVWPETYASWNFDIGIAPLWISNFNKGKSNLKWLENSARKIPTVATDICTYQTIKHGETGYLVKDTDEWVSVLTELIKKPELRHKIGQNAYDEVKTKFNAEKNAYLYAQTYEKIIKENKNAIQKSITAEMDVLGGGTRQIEKGNRQKVG